MDRINCDEVTAHKTGVQNFPIYEDISEMEVVNNLDYESHNTPVYEDMDRLDDTRCITCAAAKRSTGHHLDKSMDDHGNTGGSFDSCKENDKRDDYNLKECSAYGIQQDPATTFIKKKL